jgi:hypothetical protein
VLAVTASAAQAQPAFDRKPTAVRVGDETRIDFSADRATDVAVRRPKQAVWLLHGATSLPSSTATGASPAPSWE